ncbi:MAG TPA: Spy/CpxP family protein refolding chaperone [Bryobacteraceae bacterium]
MKLPLAFLGIIVAGTLAAQQSTQPGSNQNYSNQKYSNQTQATKGPDYISEHLAKELNLTPDQQTKVRAIFADTHQRAQALEPKMREQREALKTAVKAGNDREIDRILQQNAQLNADFQAMHVKAMAKVYALLTPDQKTKFDQLDFGWFGPAHHGVSRTANGPHS